MFQTLLYKQVECSRVELLQFMYPNFKIVKSEIEIERGEPFIYVGLLKDISKIRKRLEPYIIVANTGEYNLNDANVLINLAYEKHNKKKPKYVDDLVSNWTRKDGSYSPEFYYNWKHLWVTGSIPDKELSNNRIFLDIIKEINKPMKAISIFLTESDSSNIDYLEKRLFKFFLDSSLIDLSENVNNTSWLSNQKRIFKASYLNSSNSPVNSAIDNLVSKGGSLEDKTLRIYTLLKNALLGDRV